MAIDFVAMPLSRFIAGDFVSPSMQQAWDRGAICECVADGGTRELIKGTPWGGAAAPHRRRDLFGPLDDWLRNLPEMIPDQLWNERSDEAPRFFRVDEASYRALHKQATTRSKPERSLLGFLKKTPVSGHAGAALLIPCAFDAPFEMTAPLKRRTGSSSAAVRELTDAKWSKEAMPARDALLAALEVSIALKLPLLVMEVNDGSEAPMRVEPVVLDPGSAVRIAAVWGRIEAWITTHAPKLLAELRPPATLNQIGAAEAVLGVQLPDDVRALYRLHDGNGRAGSGLLGGWTWLDLATVVDEWNVWKELLDKGTFEGAETSPASGVCGDWWNTKWIPITYSGAGDHHCVDLAPVEGGTSGQIIEMWHDMDGRPRVAVGIHAWLEQLATGLESGACVYSEVYGALPSVIG